MCVEQELEFVIADNWSEASSKEPNHACSLMLSRKITWHRGQRPSFGSQNLFWTSFHRFHRFHQPEQTESECYRKWSWLKRPQITQGGERQLRARGPLKTGQNYSTIHKAILSVYIYITPWISWWGICQGWEEHGVTSITVIGVEFVFAISSLSHTPSRRLHLAEEILPNTG